MHAPGQPDPISDWDWFGPEFNIEIRSIGPFKINKNALSD